MKYNPKFTIWLDNNVLIAMVKGSWTEQDAKDYARDFKASATPLTGSDWAHIVYLDNWQLGAPEIEPVVKDLVSWCLQNSLRYTAQVYCPNMVKQYQLDRMIIDNSSQFEKRVYPNQQDAFAWLESLGFGSQCQSLLKSG